MEMVPEFENLTQEQIELLAKRLPKDKRTPENIREEYDQLIGDMQATDFCLINYSDAKLAERGASRDGLLRHRKELLHRIKA